MDAPPQERNPLLASRYTRIYDPVQNMEDYQLEDAISVLMLLIRGYVLSN